MKKRKLADSFKYAGQGLKTVFLGEQNFRIHCAALIIVTAAGFIARLSLSEWVLVSVAAGFVLAAELANTAIEKLVDMITKEYSEEAKAVKDISAGFVLVSAIVAALVGVLVFSGAFLRLIGE